MKTSNADLPECATDLIRMRHDANSHLESLVTAAQERADRLRVPADEASKLITEALLRLGMNDASVREASLQRERSIWAEAMRSQSRQRDQAAHHESASARAMVIKPFATVRDAPGLNLHGLPPGFVPAEDTHLQIFSAPYVDQWKAGEGYADRVTGTFGFEQFAGGGESANGSGAVWVQFVPSAGVRFVQVRPYVPYLYQWFDASFHGYVAHNRGGFGILVLSFDSAGGDRKTEQDFRYEAWNDGTAWYETHGNPAWRSDQFWDDDHAYLWGNSAPYFPVDPNRIYLAAVWCFGHCDADSGLFGGALSQGNIEAKAVIVVIGEQ